ASPLTWTTQAPHWLVSHPTWGAVRPRCSRRSCPSSVRPSTVAVAGFPLTVRLTVFCIATSLVTQAPRRAGRAALAEFRAPPAAGQGARKGVGFGAGGSTADHPSAAAPGLTASTNLLKKSSAILRAVASIRREPICASLPPT